MDNDQIVVSAQHQYQSQDSFFKRLFTNKKLLLIVGVILALELGWAGYTLTRPVPPSNFQASTGAIDTTVDAKSAATITLSGPDVAKVGETFTVEVVLTVPTATDATDVILNYNTTQLEVVKTGELAAKIGQIYLDYPVNSVDVTEGQVVLAGATPPGSSSFVGEGIFATVTFRAKTVGQAEIAVDFIPGSTTDSNIVDSKLGRDILDRVSNLKIAISN